MPLLLRINDPVLLLIVMPLVIYYIFLTNLRFFLCFQMKLENCKEAFGLTLQYGELTKTADTIYA